MKEKYQYHKVKYFTVNKSPYFLISSRSRFQKRGSKEMKQYNYIVDGKSGVKYFFVVKIEVNEEGDGKNILFNQLEQNYDVKNLHLKVNVDDRHHFFKKL